MTQKEFLEIDTSVENLQRVNALIQALGFVAVLSPEQEVFFERIQLEKIIIETALNSMEPHYHRSRKQAA